MFNRAKEYQRAWYQTGSGVGETSALGTVQIIFQTCKHNHITREDALTCDLGGDFLYERTEQRLEQLRPWERDGRADLTQEQAQSAVDDAMVSVNPNLAVEQQYAQASARVFQRGKLFDVMVFHAGPLFSQYESAIRERLRERVGEIEQKGYD